MKTVCLAGGCFWGVEKYLSMIGGVVGTRAGYANGGSDKTGYGSVCSGSGHAEAVEVVYDSDAISLGKLLSIFYRCMDPLSVNKQGNDRGVQYRTGIYYTNPEDEHAIRASVSELEKALGKRTAIEVLPLKNWCTGEEYHQKYLDRNPGGYCHISPALFAEAERSNPVPRYEPSPDSPLPICSTP